MAIQYTHYFNARKLPTSLSNWYGYENVHLITGHVRRAHCSPPFLRCLRFQDVCAECGVKRETSSLSPRDLSKIPEQPKELDNLKGLAWKADQILCQSGPPGRLTLLHGRSIVGLGHMVRHYEPVTRIKCRADTKVKLWSTFTACTSAATQDGRGYESLMHVDESSKMDHHLDVRWALEQTSEVSTCMFPQTTTWIRRFLHYVWSSTRPENVVDKMSLTLLCLWESHPEAASMIQHSGTTVSFQAFIWYPKCDAQKSQK